MRVVLYAADTGGCGLYRMVYPGRTLQHSGDFDVHVISPGEAGSDTQIMLDETGERLVNARMPPTDVVVFQRLTHPWHLDLVRLLQRNGIAVVVDFDDDLEHMDPQNLAWPELHPRSQSRNSWHIGRQVAQEADLVTVTTPALAALYAPHGRVAILPNMLPGYAVSGATMAAPPRVFGWGGHTGSHPNDLPVVGGSVRQLDRAGYQFQVVGPPSAVRRDLGLDDEPEYTGSVHPLVWVEALSKFLRVGMAPLADTRFNKAKSYLKMLEYAAAGVPCVVSPRDQYRHVLDSVGFGLAAEKPKEWARQLRTLLDDEDLWGRQRDIGRAWATSQTYENNAIRWWNAWKAAYDHRKGR